MSSNLSAHQTKNVTPKPTISLSQPGILLLIVNQVRSLVGWVEKRNPTHQPPKKRSLRNVRLELRQWHKK
ncbi:MAG: hypothetical protein QNJ33_04555 [Crocosphaera sp.]|nr:hypothetical protein [Crocosphaera sp.]